MIGGGIFVLPAIAYEEAGPAVVAAYLLAGLLVLPNALSKAEMATAMPRDGGTYLYIDRAMGPLFGTIAGIGVWFSLVFKSAFALVGLGAYLPLLVDIPPGAVTVIVVSLGALVVLLNVIGTEQSGTVQGVLVTLIVVVLGSYVLGGVPAIESAQFRPFATHGTTGVVTATAIVFVSYAGIGEVASIAEEITDPSRNIPRAMLLSIGAMMVIYVTVVGVIVGVVSPETLLQSGPNGGRSLTPMAHAAGAVFGGVGVTVVSVTAVLALAGMANAGVLGTSRFLLAMSRDSLLPESVGAINSRLLTPVRSILITGAVLLALIAFVPVVELARLTSAFLILVFSLENLSVVILRKSDADFYTPAFSPPGYPFVQLFGVAGRIVLLTQLGVVPILGVVGIITAGTLWYLLYGRSRTDRVGALATILRQRWRSDRTADEMPVQPTRDQD
jgi:APA family basic amino acid/polyamine antiporter